MSKTKWTDQKIEFIQSLSFLSNEELAIEFNRKFNETISANAIRKALERYMLPVYDFNKTMPKILLFDIETFPIQAFVWSLWQDRINLDMVVRDWSVLSWAAKWYKSPPNEVFYEDVEKQANLFDDKKILKKLWKLLDEADYVIGHNSDAFDIKKVNSRFLELGMKPPSSYKRLDTLKLAKKHFKFSSNKLSELTSKLCKKYKKSSHSKFAGTKLWMECIARNPQAFKEMKDYNKLDVLSLEELFEKLLPWQDAFLFNKFNVEKPVCSCGNDKFKKSGIYYTNAHSYQKYQCTNCGAECRDKKHLPSDKKSRYTKVVR